MQPLMPDIQSDMPLPSRSMRTMPDLNTNTELKVRAMTIKYLSDLSGTPITPTEEQQVEAEELAHTMIQNPAMKPEFTKYTSETMLYLAGMVAQSNVQLVDELSELKMYVVNKLIYEVEHANDSKSRITALSKLGEVDGVDAFKKRTETTITVKPMEEVEKELLTILENIEYTVLPEDTRYVSNILEDEYEDGKNETIIEQELTDG